MAIRILQTGAGLALTEDAGEETVTVDLADVTIAAAFFNQETDPAATVTPENGTRWFKPSVGRLYTWVTDGTPVAGQWVEF